MGCFSFKCVECGSGIESTSYSGQNVSLFLLQSGKVIQEMHGPYNSYGGVFVNGKRDKNGNRLSKEWENPNPEIAPTQNEQHFIDKNDKHWIWLRICDMIFSKDKTTGIAAVHKKCFKKVPVVKSPDDPNQGWGGTHHDPKNGPYNVFDDLN